MKTVGLLSFTPRSLIKYYFELNELLHEKFEVSSSADIVINSIDTKGFLLDKNEDELISLISKGLLSLERGGANFILIGANSPHIFYDKIKDIVKIPIIHIASVIEKVLNEKNIKKAGILSTKITFENNFYKEKIKNIELISPEDINDINFVDDVIYNELIEGIHNVDSRNTIIEISEKMVEKGAEAIILGSAEFVYFICDEYISVPVIDMTLAHTRQAFELAIEE